jgi:hypothetical protein
MSENDNELREALAQDGTFDARKAAEIKQQIVVDFGAKLRKVERTMWAFLLLCLCMMLLAACAFSHSSGVKELILYAVGFLVFYESTVLMKLWYWVANTKISVLKEIKLLRLGRSVDIEPAGGFWWKWLRTDGVSRWERIFWTMVVCVVAAFTGIIMVNGGTMPGINLGAGLTCEEHVLLNADGGGVVTTTVEACNESKWPMASLAFQADVDDEVQWLDDRGRPLTVECKVKDHRKNYTVDLPKLVMPGESFKYTRIVKSPALAKRQNDGVWVYDFNKSYDHTRNDVRALVRIPEGAKCEAFWVRGSYRSVWQWDRQSLADGRRDRDKPIDFTVKYRMPDGPKAKQAPLPQAKSSAQQKSQ